MSKWDKHIQPSKDIGVKVDSMKILEVGGDNVSLRLECPKCGISFWFDGKLDGRNSVQREEPDGEKCIHAKCPKCGVEWDGDLAHYYLVGFLEPPPDHIRQMAANIGIGNLVSRATGLNGFIVVKADNSVDAIQQAITQIPEGMNREHGFAAIPVNREEYENYLEKTGMKQLRQGAHSKGKTIGGLMEEFVKSIERNGGTADQSKDKVMRAIEGEGDDTK